MLSFAFAQRLGVGYGCRIVLADRDADSLSKAEQELSQADVDVIAVNTDVSDYASVEKLRDQVDSKMGGADIVLLAAAIAGSPTGGPYTNLESWQKVCASIRCALTSAGPFDQFDGRRQRHSCVRAGDGQAHGTRHDHLRRLKAR